MPNSFLSRIFSYVSPNLQSLSLQNVRFLWKILVKMQEKFGNVCVLRNYAVNLQVKSETKTNKEMITVKSTSKKGQHFLSAYQTATSRSVKEYYKTASHAKVSAENSILSSICEAFKNTYRVLSGNTFFFTAAYQSADGLVVETPANTYLVTD